MEFIDRKALYNETKGYCERYNITNWTTTDILEWIVGTQTVDTVEVVRCKDCLWANTNLFAKELGIVYCNNYGKRKKQDDFCSEGERRGD